MHRSDGAEIADGGVIRTLRIGELIGQLGNHEVQIRIPLTMGMGGLVDRHAVDVGFQIRAVIEIVAAQEVLIRLALAAVQGHDQPRHRFQQLTGAVLRSELQLLIIDHPFARGGGGAQQLQATGRDRDFPQCRRTRAGSRRIGGIRVN